MLGEEDSGIFERVGVVVFGVVDSVGGVGEDFDCGEGDGVEDVGFVLVLDEDVVVGED